MAVARPPLCVFHRNCLDGQAAAAVVQRKEGEVDLLPWQYGDPPPDDVTDRRVWIVDCCLQEDAMRTLHAASGDVRWIDHHATHQAIRDRLGWGTLDMSECGATLTWQVCFPEEPLPDVLAYVRDRDLWHWRLPEARAITAGLIEHFANNRVDGLLDVDLASMAEIGRPLVQAQQRRVRLAIHRGVRSRDPYGLLDHVALVINTALDISEIGERAYAPEDQGGQGVDLAIIYTQRQDGAWIHSLRADHVDCRAIAEARGGGGHPAAASYVAPMPFPFSDDCLDWPVHV